MKRPRTPHRTVRSVIRHGSDGQALGLSPRPASSTTSATLQRDKTAACRCVIVMVCERHGGDRVWIDRDLVQLSEQERRDDINY